MASDNLENTKISSIALNTAMKGIKYNTEDVSKAVEDFIQKHAPKPRISRKDLKPGDIVVVLEGAYTGKKVVFIKQLSNCIALVSGVSSINQASVFKIDERYLLKLNTSIEIPADIKINADNIFESKITETSLMETEPSDEEKKLEEVLTKSITKVKFMKAYLAEPFKVDLQTEFYSQSY